MSTKCSETAGLSVEASGGKRGETLAVAIVTALDETREESPVQLYDHVDAGAVGQLLAHAETRAESEWELTFAVGEADVTVTSDGEFTVR
jgi:hypothetical protein